MIVTWLPLLSFWWIILAAVFFVWISIATESDSISGVVWGVLTWVLVTGLVGDTFHVFSWLADHPMHLLYLPVGYFLVGLSWGMFRWWWDLSKMRREYNRIRESWFLQKKICTPLTYNKEVDIPPGHIDNWRNHLSSYKCTPQAFTFKSQRRNIGMRMSLWPFSMVGWVVADFLVNAYDMILTMLRSLFESIHTYMWSDALRDFDMPVDDERKS